MHITLVHPPTIATVTTLVEEAVPPLGLAYVAAALEAARIEVSVVDAVGEGIDQHRIYSRAQRSLLRGLTFAEIAARIPQSTRVIGVSCMFSTAWLPTRDLARHLRGTHPNALIVLGGEHATACWRYILETEPAVDYCVLGEGEQTVVDLARCIDAGGDPCTVSGIALRDGNGQPAETPRTARLRAIDAIARPAWHLFPLERYIEGRHNHGVHRGRSMPILASRGCPYQCTFCSSPRMWTTKWLARDPRDLLDEMKGYIAKYRVNDFAFYDLTAIIKRDWIIEFARLLIDEKLAITWQLPSGTRSEAIDAEVCALLYRSGCRNMNYAPESGSPSVLRRIKKRVKLDRMMESMRAASREGIEIKTNIILGFPGETRAEVLETYAFIARLALLGVEAVSVFPFCCYPGSEIFDDLVAQKKLALSDEYFHELVFTDYGRIVSRNEHFSSSQLRLAVLLANAIFYGVQFGAHPARLLTLARQLLGGRQESKVANAVEPMRKRRREYRRLVRQERRGI